MAIRRPSLRSPEWLFTDSLYFDNAPEQLRFVEVRWDGEIYSRSSQAYDYSDPPYVGSEQRGGSIVARIDYTLNDKLVTIDSWEVNWRDEWPLRLAVNYLVRCLYKPQFNYVVRVAKDAYPFWVSEGFEPVTNSPLDYLAQ